MLRGYSKLATIEEVRGPGPYDLTIGLVGSEDFRSRNPLPFTGKLSKEPGELRRKFKAIVVGVNPDDITGERWRVAIKIVKADTAFVHLVGKTLEGVYFPNSHKGNFSIIG